MWALRLIWGKGIIAERGFKSMRTPIFKLVGKNKHENGKDSPFCQEIGYVGRWANPVLAGLWHIKGFRGKV